MGRKSDTAFSCSRCGRETTVYAEQCPYCKSFNSYISLGYKDAKRVTLEALNREMEDDSDDDEDNLSSEYIRPVRACDIDDDETARIQFGIEALDTVLGDEEVKGAALGSCILFGGDPGTGKTTLAVQAALNLADAGAKTLLGSGEMTPIRSRALAKRVGPWTKTSAKKFHILEGTDLDNLCAAVRKMLPAVLVVDSLQYFTSLKVEGARGSVNQLKNNSVVLSELAHETNCIVFAICHVNKEGDFAGPKTCEHDVDASLNITKCTDYEFTQRVKLSMDKNRFGSSSLTGYMRMTNKGLVYVSDDVEAKTGT